LRRGPAAAELRRAGSTPYNLVRLAAGSPFGWVRLATRSRPRLAGPTHRSWVPHLAKWVPDVAGSPPCGWIPRACSGVPRLALSPLPCGQVHTLRLRLTSCVGVTPCGWVPVQQGPLRYRVWLDFTLRLWFTPCGWVHLAVGSRLRQDPLPCGRVPHLAAGSRLAPGSTLAPPLRLGHRCKWVPNPVARSPRCGMVPTP
jgi:hypothetical protein